MEEKLKFVQRLIKSYPDFPKPGVIFRDIFPIFLEHDALSSLIDVMTEHVRQMQADVIIGLESRGFLLAPLIAFNLKLPFVPLRKGGKLPGPVFKESYSLEYGQDTLEIQQNSIKEGQNVAIVDDLLATGGTLGVSVKLVEKTGANVAGCLTVLELKDLRGREKVNAPVHSLFSY